MAPKGFDCGLEHFRLGDVFPGDAVPVHLCHMADEFPLGSPVAFAERVQGVQFAQKVGCAEAEIFRVETGEVPFLRKRPKDGHGGAFKVPMMGKHAAAFADVDGSQLTSPFIHIAEKLPVKMDQVEVPLKGRFRKLKRTCCCKSGFGFFKRRLAEMPRRFLKTPVAGSR